MLEHGLPVQLVAGGVSRLCLHWNFHVLRFRLDPQPATRNSQPSSHHVPNVTNDVPPWGILKLGPSKENWAVVLAATSGLRPGAFLKWHPNQVPKVNHDVLCRDRQKVGDCETFCLTLKKGDQLFKTNRSKQKHKLRRRRGKI
jgi:hypothetical protein